MSLCVTSATQKKKPALRHFRPFLVTELHSKEGKAPKLDLWGRAHHTTTPHPGWGIPRGMDGGGPVNTAVTSPCPLLDNFIPRSPAFPRTHLGPLLQTAIKIKRLRVRSSHIVESKADIELRSNREEKKIDQKSSKRGFYSGWLISVPKFRCSGGAVTPNATGSLRPHPSQQAAFVR